MTPRMLVPIDVVVVLLTISLVLILWFTRPPASLPVGPGNGAVGPDRPPASLPVGPGTGAGGPNRPQSHDPVYSAPEFVGSRPNWGYATLYVHATLFVDDNGRRRRIEPGELFRMDAQLLSLLPGGGVVRVTQRSDGAVLLRPSILGGFSETPPAEWIHPGEYFLIGDRAFCFVGIDESRLDVAAMPPGMPHLLHSDRY